MTRSASPIRGFTLLELIVAIGMAAALGVALYTSVAIAFRARDSIRQQTRGPREAGIALDVLRRDFESALPPSEEGMAGPFLGTPSGNANEPADTVEFYTVGRDAELADTDDPYQPNPTAEGVRWVQLALRTDVDPPVLVRRVDPNVLATTPIEPPDQVLLTGVRSLGFRYFDGSTWLTEWDSTLTNNALPLAVEITLELDTPSPTGGETYRVSEVIPLACGNLDAILTTTEDSTTTAVGG